MVLPGGDCGMMQEGVSQGLKPKSPAGLNVWTEVQTYLRSKCNISHEGGE